MIIAFVPLRGGSKSIPLKNIKNFCGKPLAYWNLKALQDSKVDEIIVATDSDEIKRVVESFSFSKVRIYERDPKNAQDHSSTESVMLEFLHFFKADPQSLFILVQATSPLTQTSDFDNAIRLFTQSRADSLLSCVKTKRFFWDMAHNPLNYDPHKRPRRQDFAGLFMENGAFYISRVQDILRTQNRLSGNIAIYEMQEYQGIEIDEPLDWEIAQMLMRHYQRNRLVDSKIRSRIKLFSSDVDGTLTDGGMYYCSNGIESKKFNTLDGKGFELLRQAGIKIAILTGENTPIVQSRAAKLQVDYLYMGLSREQKLAKIQEICAQENISLDSVAYIGDDINDELVLRAVGLGACPKDAHPRIASLPRIMRLSRGGGQGAVREFVDYLLQNTNQN